MRSLTAVHSIPRSVFTGSFVRGGASQCWALSLGNLRELFASPNVGKAYGIMNMTSPSERYDPWYAKAAFGVFLFGLVATLIALYSGVSDSILVRLLDIIS